MALGLLGKVLTFEIKHKPNMKLQLRMGIHCGQVGSTYFEWVFVVVTTRQVVCGVVGTRIPHYSVLGDTVEIASLMESSGLPMMIQITESVNLILERDGTFTTTIRGKINIPGLGEMRTHWLVGRQEKNDD